jgi:hypothetical protein
MDQRETGDHHKQRTRHARGVHLPISAVEAQRGQACHALSAEAVGRKQSAGQQRQGGKGKPVRPCGRQTPIDTAAANCTAAGTKRAGLQMKTTHWVSAAYVVTRACSTPSSRSNASELKSSVSGKRHVLEPPPARRRATLSQPSVHREQEAEVEPRADFAR